MSMTIKPDILTHALNSIVKSLKILYQALKGMVELLLQEFKI